MKNRENNQYKNIINGTVINSTQMLEYVKCKTKRQYEDLHNDKFEDCTIDNQQEMILNQFAKQLNTDWVVI